MNSLGQWLRKTAGLGGDGANAAHTDRVPLAHTGGTNIPARHRPGFYAHEYHARATYDGDNAFPAFLTEAKHLLLHTTVCRDFRAKMHDTLRLQVLPHFSAGKSGLKHLTATEMLALADQTEAVLRSDRYYVAMQQAVEDVLQDALGRAVHARLAQLGSTLGDKDVRMHVAKEELGKACCGLLHKWPDLRSRMKAMAGAAMPMSLRRMAWRASLRDHAAYEDCKALEAAYYRKQLSKQTMQALHYRAQDVLGANKNFAPVLAHDENVICMRRAFAYFHSRSEGRLERGVHYLMVPLLGVYPSDGSVEHLCEIVAMTQGFLRAIPQHWRVDTADEYTVMRQTQSQLHAADAQLLDHMRAILAEGDVEMSVDILLQMLMHNFFIGKTWINRPHCDIFA